MNKPLIGTYPDPACIVLRACSLADETNLPMYCTDSILNVLNDMFHLIAPREYCFP